MPLQQPKSFRKYFRLFSTRQHAAKKLFLARKILGGPLPPSTRPLAPQSYTYGWG